MDSAENCTKRPILKNWKENWNLWFLGLFRSFWDTLYKQPLCNISWILKVKFGLQRYERRNSFSGGKSSGKFSPAPSPRFPQTTNKIPTTNTNIVTRCRSAKQKVAKKSRNLIEQKCARPVGSTFAGAFTAPPNFPPLFSSPASLSRHSWKWNHREINCDFVSSYPQKFILRSDNCQETPVGSLILLEFPETRKTARLLTLPDSLANETVPFFRVTSLFTFAPVFHGDDELLLYFTFALQDVFSRIPSRSVCHLMSRRRGFIKSIERESNHLYKNIDN